MDVIAQRIGQLNGLLVAEGFPLDLARLGRDMEKVDSYLRWLEDRFVDVICADGTVPQTSMDL